jgi:tRNA/tmRNA/rRNA uracil-C5-methylase (TrmA/RlmC/RlmD family)
VAAPEVLVDAVTRFADVKPGDHLIDLYGGVGLFGVFTGFIASWFVEEHKREDEEVTELTDQN